MAEVISAIMGYGLGLLTGLVILKVYSENVEDVPEKEVPKLLFRKKKTEKEIEEDVENAFYK